MKVPGDQASDLRAHWDNESERDECGGAQRREARSRHEGSQPEEARVLLGEGHGSISVSAATVFAREDGDRA